LTYQIISQILDEAIEETKKFNPDFAEIRKLFAKRITLTEESKRGEKNE